MTTRRLVPLLLVASWLTTASLAPAQVDGGKPTAEAFAQRIEQVRQMMWWNKPARAAELSLSDEQREAMDAALRVYLEARRTDAADHQEVFQSFGKALVAGNAKATREVGERVIETIATPMRRQIELMIEVIALLTPPQREILATRYPQLVNRPWIVGGSMRSTGRDQEFRNTDSLD